MFSVVIPLFNKRPYVQRALDSVYAQTCRPAEIIVVDDGSTDGGEAIVASQADPRVILVRQANRGVSAARNVGLDRASQPYVAFLDADDRWLPYFLERMQTAIESHPGANLYASGFVTMSGGRPCRQIGIKRVGGVESPREVDYFDVVTGGHPLHMSTTVAPVAAARAVGGFAEEVEFCEDHLFWARLALSGRVVLTPEVLAEYDVAVPGQAVEVWRTKYRQRVLEYHRFLAEELRSRGVTSNPSFVRHSKREFRVALLQRLYWGDFESMTAFWQELRLSGIPLGLTIKACGWIAAHPAVQPVVAVVAGLTRGLRGAANKRRRGLLRPSPVESLRQRRRFPDGKPSGGHESVVRDQAER